MVKRSRNRERGKDFEKAMAKMFNADRMGLFGGEDLKHEFFSIECKSRKSFIGKKWFEQCVKNNKRVRIPLVVVHVANTDYNSSLVMLNINDFLMIYGTQKKEISPEQAPYNAS